LPTRNDVGLQLSLRSKQAMIRDMVTAVRNKAIPALLITGRPGVGKSHLVREVLGDPETYVFRTGYLTRPEAVELLAKSPDRLHVFDDVGGCLTDPNFQQVLLNALCTADSAAAREDHGQVSAVCREAL
jgi:predicted GTPase